MLMRSLFNQKDDVTAVKLKMAARRSKNPVDQFQSVKLGTARRFQSLPRGFAFSLVVALSLFNLPCLVSRAFVTLIQRNGQDPRPCAARLTHKLYFHSNFRVASELISLR